MTGYGNRVSGWCAWKLFAISCARLFRRGWRYRLADGIEALPARRRTTAIAAPRRRNPHWNPETQIFSRVVGDTAFRAAAQERLAKEVYDRIRGRGTDEGAANLDPVMSQNDARPDDRM